MKKYIKSDIETASKIDNILDAVKIETSGFSRDYPFQFDYELQGNELKITMWLDDGGRYLDWYEDIIIDTDDVPELSKLELIRWLHSIFLDYAEHNFATED